MNSLGNWLRKNLHPKLYEIILRFRHLFIMVIWAPWIQVQKCVFMPDPMNRNLNIGGGRWYLKHWENIDLYTWPAVFVDYKVDLRTSKELPFPDGCAQRIYTSHLLEHLDDECVLNLLKECNRILKKDGYLRVSVPDMDKVLVAYWHNDVGFFQNDEIFWVGDSIERRLVNYFASYDKGEYTGGPVVDDYIVREKISTLSKHEFVEWCRSLIPYDASKVEHINGYDYQKLQGFLKLAGFSYIYQSSFKSSKDPVMRGGKIDNRPTISLFVEAIK